mmetsp:Transcript_3587/g.5207  ORF Transcript_3587/g.5207 Transcript_3587/m.5207 type:complete len:206 (-) Transcript_3587:1186-1803(-)
MRPDTSCPLELCTTRMFGQTKQMSRRREGNISTDAHGAIRLTISMRSELFLPHSIRIKIKSSSLIHVHERTSLFLCNRVSIWIQWFLFLSLLAGPICINGKAIFPIPNNLFSTVTIFLFFIVLVLSITSDYRTVSFFFPDTLFIMCMCICLCFHFFLSEPFLLFLFQPPNFKMHQVIRVDTNSWKSIVNSTAAFFTLLAIVSPQV